MSDSPTEVSLWERQRTLWKENHVGLILVVMAGVLTVGASVLAYRQSRFRPPRFPDGSAIQSQGRGAITTTGDDDLAASETLQIRVAGAANPSGVMFLAIYDAANGFNDPSQAIARVRNQIVEGESSFMLRAKDFPAKIAIAAYHDENADGELNRNAIGIPLERYGFSNNARGTLGPPSFNECLIDRPESGTLEIFIR